MLFMNSNLCVHCGQFSSSNEWRWSRTTYNGMTWCHFNTRYHKHT